MIQEKGYIVTKFLKETDFNHLVLELEKYVKKQLESLNIKVNDLRQYHESVNNDDLHYEVYQKLYKNGSSFEEIDFDTTIIETRISKLLKRKLVIRDDYYHDRKQIFIRVIRPKKNDVSPIHRDTWLDALKECGINLYIPLWGSNELSSIAVCEGSHKWENLVKENVKQFTVPKLKDNNIPLIRPNPKPNEVLIFLPKLLHSGLNNISHETRFSLEVRLYDSLT